MFRKQTCSDDHCPISKTREHCDDFVPLCAALLSWAAVDVALHQCEKVGHFCPEQRFNRPTTFWLDRVDSPHLCCDQSAERKHFLR